MSQTVFRSIRLGLHLVPVLLSLLGRPLSPAAWLAQILQGTMVMVLCLYLIRCLTSPLQYFYHEIEDLFSTIGQFLHQEDAPMNAQRPEEEIVQNLRERFVNISKIP